MLVGVTAGYIGGIGDETLSVLANVFLVIPQLPLIIIIAGQLPSAGGLTVALVIAVTGWAWGARVLRAQTLSLRRRDFVEAARANGERTWRIITAEILPNLTAIIAAGFVGTVGVRGPLARSRCRSSASAPPASGTGARSSTGRRRSSRCSAARGGGSCPPGLLHRPVGMALTLINFGIDEFVNPRLRSTGLTPGRCASAASAPRIGFTPVVLRGHGRTAHDPSPAPLAGTRARGDAADADPVLEIKNLSVDYGFDDDPTHVLRQVSLTLNRGEVLGLAGRVRLRQVDARVRGHPAAAPARPHHGRRGASSPTATAADATSSR